MSQSSPRKLPLRRRFWVRHPWMEFRYRFYAGAVARELNETSDFADRSHDHLEARVAAIEEIIAADWPQCLALLLQLRREMRETDAAYAQAAATFRRRRTEWASDEVIESSLRFARRHGGKR